MITKVLVTASILVSVSHGEGIENKVIESRGATMVKVVLANLNQITETEIPSIEAAIQ